jgi:hypothetical protein
MARRKPISIGWLRFRQVALKVQPLIAVVTEFPLLATLVAFPVSGRQ